LLCLLLFIYLYYFILFFRGIFSRELFRGKFFLSNTGYGSNSNFP
jgi:hypothetical protein